MKNDLDDFRAQIEAMRQDLHNLKMGVSKLVAVMAQFSRIAYQLSARIHQHIPLAAPIAGTVEQQIEQALIEHGGPPEIAAQLVTIAKEQNLTAQLLPWIRYHLGNQWSAAEFNEWCYKFRAAQSDIERTTTQ